MDIAAPVPNSISVSLPSSTTGILIIGVLKSLWGSIRNSKYGFFKIILILYHVMMSLILHTIKFLMGLTLWELGRGSTLGLQVYPFSTIETLGNFMPTIFLWMTALSTTFTFLLCWLSFSSVCFCSRWTFGLHIMQWCSQLSWHVFHIISAASSAKAISIACLKLCVWKKFFLNCFWM